MEILGIDIGGSGIKGAIVDVENGVLATERFRIPTPNPSTPKKVAKVVAQIAAHFSWKNAPIGCTFPAVVQNGVTLSAANVDSAWINAPAQTLLSEKTKCPVLLLNDADAAGVAEMAFGAGRGERGVVMILTFGTGIGSAIFVDGHLLPNTELGHLELRGTDAEKWASARVRKADDLSWRQWGKAVDAYLAHLEKLFSPELFIIGGGVSKRFEKFSDYLHRKARIVPAQLRNEAGIVGAAMAAKVLSEQK